MRSFIYLFVAMSLLLGCNPSTETSNDVDPPPNAGLIGTWSWAKYSISNQDTSYTWTNLVGQLIYTENHYSLLMINSDEPREIIPKRSSAMTADELRVTISPVSANSGSYRIEGDKILMFREIALWPSVMESDNQLVEYDVPRITKDSLIWSTDTYLNIWVRKK